jgi:hypothetical protein
MKEKIKWVYLEPKRTMMGVAGGNYVYHIGKSYFSYNPAPNNNFIDQMFDIHTGEETAFYNARKDDFIILLGDFREEISKREIRTWREAINFCKEKYPKDGGEMTTDGDFNKVFS